jgi:hypothetical protein
MLRLALPGAAVAAAALVLAACSADTPTESQLASRAGARPGPAASSSDFTLYAVHGINGRDLGAAEALPVDVKVGDICALQGFTFRTIAGPLTLPAANYRVQVSLANADTPCSNAPVIDAEVPFAAGENVSLVAHLTAAGAPTASKFVNDLSRIPGRARIEARHTAQFGPVDVLIDRASAQAIAVPDLTTGNAAGTPIRPGEHTVALRASGTDVIAYDQTLTLKPFTAYFAYAVGTPANNTFEVLLQALPTR